jgi:hypothetical protein
MVYILAYQKSQFGHILEGFEKVGIFYGDLEYFVALW